jgi:type II secretory pathway pseudopilin PulG
MRTIQASRPGQDGGFALIDLLFVIAIIGTIASMAIPGLLRARASAGLASAVGSLRVINSAQISYAITCGSGFYAPNLTTLGTVPPGAQTSFISTDLGVANTVVKANYQIQMFATGLAGTPPGCSGLAAGQSGTGYKAGADSLDPVLNRFFATNASGVIYEADVTLYPTMPEAAPPLIGTPIQ